MGLAGNRIGVAVGMNTCAESRRLKNEIRHATDLLLDLFRRKRSAFAFGHENTLRVIDREIERVFRDKARTTAALERHEKEHRCGVASGAVE